MSRKTVIVIIVLFSAVVFYLTRHIGFNRTDSVNFKIYWHYPAKSIEKGKYYVIDYIGSEYKGLITKKVVCLPGDELIRVGNSFYCNDIYVAGIVITHSENGEEYPQYNPDPESGRGHFVIGDATNSYDSRYFGVLPASSFRREVYPLW
jgi:type IV secretory pathway protease TraF